MLPLEMAKCDTTSEALLPNALDKLKAAERGEANHAAARCFAVPEMLEHILSFLSFKDLLHAQAVSKTIQASITSSLKVRKKLHLVADPDSAFYVLPVIPRFFTLQIRELSPIRKSNLRLEGMFWLTDANGWEMHAWRDLFVTQPPIRTMEHWLSCYRGSCMTGQVCKALHVEKGITLGSLADYTRRCVLEEEENPLAYFAAWDD